MEKLLITGGTPLKGEICISGAKNSAVAIIPASILVDGPCKIENIPDISDVKTLVGILRDLGADVEFEGKGAISIDTKNLKTNIATYDMIKKLRASYYLMGSLLGRFKEAEVSMPGGCDFGCRPIDQHIKGFEALGTEVKIDGGVVSLRAKSLKGCQIYMDVVSVGATINIMMAAVKAQGLTVIENASKEPHVVDVANFLNAMGANIKGAGTDVIKIRGVSRLPGGAVHSVIPDMVEAGTFMVAAAATGGEVTIQNVIPRHIESISAKLIEMNVQIDGGGDYVRVIGTDRIEKVNIKTLPYPGFPTDLQPLVAALLCRANGTSTITEGIWDSRYQYVDELKRMGANIKVEGRMAVVEGVPKLSGAPVRSTDLRAGAALVIAGLIAEGTTKVYNIDYIDRGYEDFEVKLKALGAQIIRKQ